MSIVVHERIAAELRGQIETGELGVGDPLPSEAQLCARYGTSRGPVRQALARLRTEGMITGGRGKPPVVSTSALAQPFDTLLSYSAWVQALGRTPGQRTIELALRPASEQVALDLRIEPGTRVVTVLRQRLLDGRPALLERSAFVEPVGRLLFDFDCDSGSIWAYLQAQGAGFATARNTIDAVAATELDAETLEVPAGTPLLRQRRLARNAAGVPLETSDDRYRPDVVTFSVENTLDAGHATFRSAT